MKKLVLLTGFMIISLLLVDKEVFANPGDIWIVPTSHSVSVDSNFVVEVHADTGGSDLGSFQLTINYEDTLLSVDTSQGVDGIESLLGSEFPFFINATVSGQLRISGLDSTGTGVTGGNDIVLMRIYFTALPENLDFTYPTNTNLDLEPQELNDSEPQPIGTLNGIGAIVTIRTGRVLTVSVDPLSTIMGSVVSTNPGINCPDDCEEIYDTGTEVTLTAQPAKGNILFDHWEGDCAGVAEPVCNLIMDADMNIIAFFKVLVGDVNCDGRVTIGDAFLTARKSVNLPLDDTPWCGD